MLKVVRGERVGDAELLLVEGEEVRASDPSRGGEVERLGHQRERCRRHGCHPLFSLSARSWLAVGSKE